MKLIADLHLHSKYSRATSKNLDILNLEKWAKIKGLNLLGTGDFLHPKWSAELKQQLTDNGKGIFQSKEGMNFILQTEVSLIYTDAGKGRRVHNLILAPDFDVVGQITEYFKSKGRVDYDGRPIFKIPCDELTESLLKISKEIEIIPAHCLLPGTHIHSNPRLKKIEDINNNDKVLTHTGKFKKVIKTYKRNYSGKVYHIIPWYFREGLVTTSEHPFYAIKSHKSCNWTKGVCKPLCSEKDNCRKKIYQFYLLGWIPAEKLKKGDFLVYPRLKDIKDVDVISLQMIVKDLDKIEKIGRTKRINHDINLDNHFCRLFGYYLAEGYTIRKEAVGFSFNKNEKDYIEDVINLMNHCFGILPTKIDTRKGSDILYFSHTLNSFFGELAYSSDKEKRAWTKSIPEFMLFLPKEKQTELLRGWWRGDYGYTVSHNLANQMKIICIRLGIIPSISKDTAENFNARGKHFIGSRKISTNKDTFIFSNLSFFEGKDLLKDPSFKKFINKKNMKHGWIDENNIYLPIRAINIEEYKGEVYNLEVEDDNSYVSEFAVVHNCWTPWFALLGSMSGYNSVKEAFKEQTKNIHALETGLSSDPEMNWRLSQLDPFALVSFSDSHSFWPWRIGREATLFDLKELSYNNLIKALRTKEGLTGTIEVDPAYGKYHFDGHRLCSVCLAPKESLKARNICPKCGKQLTIGVAHRVEELADRPEGFKPKDAKPFYKIIPLAEIISAMIGSAVSSKKTWAEFNKLIEKFGNELNILLDAPESELKKTVDEKLADAILLNRQGKIEIQPGYDGEYGIPVFSEKDKRKAEITKAMKRQSGLSDFM